MEPSHPHFHHPYRPYDIQLDFMQKLYQCIEDGKIGIFESPTGTGKSLSLLCSSLTWLRGNERRLFRNLIPSDSANGDWLVQAEIESRRRELVEERRELESQLQAVRVAEAKRNRNGTGRSFKKAKADNALDEQEFVVEDYESGEDESTRGKKHQTLSSSTQELLNRLNPSTQVHEDEKPDDRTKIIFCSRTHSQLAQIVDELSKIHLPSGIFEVKDPADLEIVKHLSLGSRKNLCINPKVSQLSSTTAMNERCLDLQKPGISKDQKCEFLPSHGSGEDRDRIEEFKRNAIADIRDIEDLGTLGKRMKLCPYYASRSVIPAAEVLTLPYPLLLQKSAREALGVSVKDNVVIIDEAHNLIDAIADALSVSLHLKDLRLARSQVTGYCQRFKNRLKGKNRVYIAQVIKLMDSCTRRMEKCFDQPEKQISVTANDFLIGAGVDQIQPHKLLNYLHESKLVYKVEGYAELIHQASATDRSGELAARDETQPKGVLAAFQNLLAALMNPATEGRFFIVREDKDVTIKYTLLDPREHFRDIVEEARSVILAGGTMSPMTDFCSRLFSYVDPDRIETFSFGHVIAKENLLVESVVKGPSGIDMDFTWKSRRSNEMIAELGRTIEIICEKAPDGIVVFFPSYDYLAFVVSIWKKSNSSGSLWEKISSLKSVFVEAKGSTTDELLHEYAKAVDSGQGAIMLAVVGGKLSEGINFSDRLGRVVICVGLPFPNIDSAEWKGKVQYVVDYEYERLKKSGNTEATCRAGSQTAGREFTDNTTMRAVNQSIGRAIRHRNDFAAILLVDKRFATERIQKKLPGWIMSSFHRNSYEWADIERNYVDFFRRISSSNEMSSRTREP